MDVLEFWDRNGVETLVVDAAKVSTLLPFVNPEIPWVWIFGHGPSQVWDWWESSLPVNKCGKSIAAEFRRVRYDMQLPTQRFLEVAAEFEELGLDLVQSSKKMPNSLDLSRIPQEQQSKVLRSNGAFLRIYLPHAVETAHVQCYEKGYLSRVLAPNKSAQNGRPTASAGLNR